MIELRQRMRGYEPVSTEEVDDEDDHPNMEQNDTEENIQRPSPKNTTSKMMY
jgi:hypothetical protein